jgi:hypothetical protein
VNGSATFGDRSMLALSAAFAALTRAHSPRGTVAGGRACLAGMSAAGFVDQAIEVGGQRATARRLVEADVGMTFKKVSLNDKLFTQPWPPEWPFSPRSFARQDESDDGDFYSQPRFVYHIDEGGLPNPPAPQPAASPLTSSSARSLALTRCAPKRTSNGSSGGCRPSPADPLH